MIFSFLSNLFGFGKAVSEEVTQRDAEHNTVDQRTNAEAAQIQADKDRAAREIADADQTNLDRDVAP
jgi:hypothetical protein